MTTYIDNLFEFCKKQPFDIEKIENYIQNNKLNSEIITRTAIKLCDYGFCSYLDYIEENDKEPMPQELPTYNWETLFNVFIENGLDADLVICDDGFNSENILESLNYLDDGDLSARILRNILSKNGNPNISIDNSTLFIEIDSNFIIDVEMKLYPYKWQLDNAFRFWLVLIGFGGVLKDGKLPVKMQGNNKPDIFKNFEKFDYRVNNFELQIIDMETNAIVATV
jgi:hypothetical protein